MRNLKALGAALIVTAAVACRDPNTVRVQLHALPTPDGGGRGLDIAAQVTGPQRGLRYKWFSVAGECDPQESERPETEFRFGSGTTRDRVSVEIWRQDERVAYGEIDVTSPVAPPPEPIPAVRIQITTVPPYEPAGGPDTRADIAGTVVGDLPPGFRVVVYARADAWYNQPSPFATHPIRTDGAWETWTHTGSSYAVLIVRPGFSPFARLDVLPVIGGDVVARTIVDGRR